MSRENINNVASSPAKVRYENGRAPLISVIIVNYNSGPHLKRCLKTLAAQTYRRFEAIIMDNASQDDSVRQAALPDARFRLVPLDGNLGFAAANNLGAKQAGGEWLATLNPDAFPEPDWLAALVEASQRHPEAVMFGSTLISAEDGRILDGAGDAYMFLGVGWRGDRGKPLTHDLPEGEVFAPCAAAALYRTKDFLQLGGFDERFFCFFEDVDLAFRLRLAGGHCVQAPKAVVRHVGGAAAGERSYFAKYHGARNRPWSFVKNMPSPFFWFFLPLHLAMTGAVLLKAAEEGCLRPVGRGVWDAIAGLRPVLQDRRRIQGGRKASLGKILGSFCWSPFIMARRGRHVRPLPVNHDKD